TFDFMASIHSHASYSSFLFTDTSPTYIYTLSLHDALPISYVKSVSQTIFGDFTAEEVLGLTCKMQNYQETSLVIVLHFASETKRSEEHTSELQSRFDLVCRLLLEKKK